ncbi:MAG: DNA-binding transcriptional LysR family regulator [Lentisphaeria bacterium]|jgi:DNA-binding transcriptional LysR family regulator
MNWDTIKLFLALHREGSARAVALQYGLSPSTVTRHISELERELNSKLFSRQSTGFQLSESGRELLHVALRMEADAYEIERKLQAKNSVMQGRIRLTIPNHILAEPLLESLALFSKTHPQVELEIIPSYAKFNLGKGEADIALRIMLKGSLPPEELIGTKLVTIYCAVYASRNYLASHDLADDKTSNWIGWDDESQYPDWVKTSAYPHLPVKHRLNDPLMQLYANKAGMGLSMMPCFLCDAEPDIIRVPAHVKWARFDLWMLSHPDLRETARFREFRQFLCEQFELNKALWSGDTYDKGKERGDSTPSLFKLGSEEASVSNVPSKHAGKVAGAVDEVSPKANTHSDSRVPKGPSIFP